ncbi:MAG: hypothetical protein ABI867_11700 [Kofleriaceae bacterium]
MRAMLMLGLFACEPAHRDEPAVMPRAIESSLPDIQCPPDRPLSIVQFVLAPLVATSDVEYRPNRYVWLFDLLFGEHERSTGQCLLRWNITL